MASSNACTRRNRCHDASKHYASPSVQPWQPRQDAGKLHCSMICSTPLLDAQEEDLMMFKSMDQSWTSSGTPLSIFECLMRYSLGSAPCCSSASSLWRR